MLPASLQNFLAEFQASERSLQADMLIELASEFHPVPPSIATSPYPQEHLVPECESQVYVWVVPRKGSCDTQESPLVDLHFAVENPQGISAKALAAVLSDCLAGSSAVQLSHLDESIVSSIFGQGISMGKGLGLNGMIRLIKKLAADL